MEPREAVTPAFDTLGLLGNPLSLPQEDTTDSDGMRLSVVAASYRLLSAVNVLASDPDHRPTVVEKGDLPAIYAVQALAPALRALATDEAVPGIMQLYVPLDMMRIGRVRAVLHSAAEWVAARQPDLTIGTWLQAALATPDEALPEWVALTEAGFDVASVATDVAEDPAGYARRIFGEPLASREGAEDLEALMRVSTARIDRLETDPVEGEESLKASEDSPDDPMAAAFVTPLGDVDETALPAADDAQPVDVESLLGDYLVAYLKKNLSPVVARGVRAYQAQGRSSMAEELKVSKAPSKTLVALVKFASPRIRAVAVMFDRFEIWPTVPADLRLKIVNTLTSLRWALKDFGGLMLILRPDIAPEVAEAFAAARRVSWRYDELETVSARDAVFDRDIVEEWIASASVDAEPPVWTHELLAAVPAGTRLDVAAAALSVAIDVAAREGAERPDPAVVSAALAAEKGVAAE